MLLISILMNSNKPGLRFRHEYFSCKNKKRIVKCRRKNYITHQCKLVYLKPVIMVQYMQTQWCLHCHMWVFFLHQCDLPLSLFANLRPTKALCYLKRSGRLTRSLTPLCQCPMAMTSPLFLNWMPPPYSGQTA